MQTILTPPSVIPREESNDGPVEDIQSQEDELENDDSVASELNQDSDATRSPTPPSSPDDNPPHSPSHLPSNITSLSSHDIKPARDIEISSLTTSLNHPTSGNCRPSDPDWTVPGSVQLVPFMIQSKSDKNFPAKLFDILNDAYSPVLKWSDEGTAIMFLPGIELESKLLLHFRTNKPTSFVRNLNSYGFSKVPSKRSRRGANQGYVEFHHPRFRRDRPDLVATIDRKSAYDNDVQSRGMTLYGSPLSNPYATPHSPGEKITLLKTELLIQLKHSVSTVMSSQLTTDETLVCNSSSSTMTSDTGEKAARSSLPKEDSIRALITALEAQQEAQRQSMRKMFDIIRGSKDPEKLEPVPENKSPTPCT